MARPVSRPYKWAAMLTVIIPTLDSETTLGPTLASLIPAACDGVVCQVVVADGGSRDATHRIADELGCDFIAVPRGRGSQLAAGADLARQPWLLFLHADTVLDSGWHSEVAAFIERTETTGDRSLAAAFRFTLDDYGSAARWLERIVALRCALLALPYGDQGLLISRRHYDQLGGFRDLPLMEDVDLVRRIGRRSLVLLRTRAVTSAARYRKRGYISRMARNAGCLALYFLRVSPRVILRLYG
jgi:rSAM/selenodomain-associated transferase 2